MKKRLQDLTKKEIIKTLDALYTAVGSLRNREAARLFLRDLLTPSERIMLGRRILIAKLLIGGATYDELARRLGVGRTTVSRVEHWLQDQFLGYERALQGIKRTEEKRKARMERNYGAFSYRALKKKYPLYFLLFPQPKNKNKKH